MTKIEIDRLILDTNELGRVIENCDLLINNIKDLEVKERYIKEMLEYIGYYNTLCHVLKVELDKYMKLQRESGSNVESLIYNKVIRSLKPKDIKIF